MIAALAILVSQVFRNRVRSRTSGGLAYHGELEDEYADEDEQALLPALLEKLGDKAKELASKVVSVAKVPFVTVWMVVKLFLKVVYAKIFAESISSTVNEFIEFDPADTIDITDWKAFMF